MDLNHRAQRFMRCCLFSRPSRLIYFRSSVVKDQMRLAGLEPATKIGSTD